MELTGRLVESGTSTPLVGAEEKLYDKDIGRDYLLA